MTLEAETIEEVRRDLRDKGYDVVMSPSSSLVPDFLSRFSPDLIAYGPRDNIVVEFSGRGETSAVELKALADAIRRHPGWRLRVIRYSPKEQLPLPTPSNEQILATLDQAKVLENSGAGLLLSWASLEATARLIDPKHFEKPQSPGRIVNDLVGRGLIDQDESVFLSKMVEYRNRLIHGDLNIRVPEADLTKFVGIVRAIAQQLTQTPHLDVQD